MRYQMDSHAEKQNGYEKDSHVVLQNFCNRQHAQTVRTQLGTKLGMLCLGRVYVDRPLIQGPSWMQTTHHKRGSLGFAHNNHIRLEVGQQKTQSAHKRQCQTTGTAKQ